MNYCLFKKISILLILLVICGCSSKVNYVYLSSIDDIGEIINKNSKTIFEISSDSCPNCAILKQFEQEIKSNNNLTIYKYVITDSFSEDDLKKIKLYFDTLQYVPTFYIIENNKIKHTLNIKDWNNPKTELRRWLNKYGD